MMKVKHFAYCLTQSQLLINNIVINHKALTSLQMQRLWVRKRKF